MDIQKFSKSRFFLAIKISLVTETVILLLSSVYALVAHLNPLSIIILVMLITASLMLIISGIIGPGRYVKPMPIVLLEPDRGASYAKDIPVSAFLIDTSVEQADVYVNGTKVETIRFTDLYGVITLNKTTIPDTTVNTIWLQSQDQRSNDSYFTCFDEDKMPASSAILESRTPTSRLQRLKLARDSYNRKLHAHYGSISLGLLVCACLLLVLGSGIDRFLR